VTLDLGSHDDRFDSAWLKWGQAVMHSQKLEADIDSFGAGANHFTVQTEYQSRRHGFAVYLDTVDPIPVRWSLMIGDVGNNFRSCLDHIAWAIVTRGRTPPDTLSRKYQNKIYLPIFDQRKMFNGSLKERLPGARRTDIARVRRYQSFQRGVSKRPFHSFTMLSAINNGNKHRTVQPVWAVPMTAEYQVLHQSDCSVPTRLGRAVRNPLMVGMELGFISATKTGPNPELRVQAELTAEPAFENRVLVRRWLYMTKGWTFLLLLEFSRPPDDLMEIGIDWPSLRLDPADAP
jgi:hypothetical protein